MGDTYVAAFLLQIWSTRSMEEIVMMERELQDVVASEVGAGGNTRFSVHLHLTSPPVRQLLELFFIYCETFYWRLLHLVRH